MSDVSGIPYMGPMGMGNFFAPPYGGGGMNMSAGQISQPYMPEIYNNQNTVQNLFNTPGGGGGFGQATNYYSGLGANYAAQGMSPFGVFNDPGTGGGGGASPYQTTPNVFETGASGYSYPGAGAIDWGGMFGGGGASPYQTSPNVFNSPGMGGGASSFQYPGMGLDWSSLYQAPQSNFSQPNTFDFGAGMFGGLAGGIGGAYQGQNNQLDWSGMFGGGGGAQTDPYPGMAMPGGLGSSMSLPQQQPVDYGSLFGQGVGGTGGAPPAVSGQFAPAPQPSAGEYGAGMFGGLAGGIGGTYQGPGNTFGERFDALGGSEPMGDNAPAPAAPDGTRTYDFAPMFEAGGGGFGAGGGDTSGTGDAPAQSFGGNAFSYMPEPSGSQDSFGPPAQALADQARTRLASLMGSGDTAPLELSVAPSEGTGRTAESAREAGGPVTSDAATGDIPLPRARPEGADVARPPASIPATTPAERQAYDAPPRPSASVPVTVEPGKEASARGIHPRLRAAVEGGAQFLPPGYSVEIFSGERFDTPGHKQMYHKGGNAMDVRIRGPDGRIPDRGADDSGMYTLLARAVKTWAGQNDPGLLQPGRGGLGYGGAFETSKGSGTSDLMHFDLGGSRGNLRPEVQFGRLQPLTEAERNAMPAYIPLLGANQVPLDGRVPQGTGSAFSARFGGIPEGTGGAGQQPAGTAWDEGRWNTEVYQPMGGGENMQRDEGGLGGRWTDFAKTGNVEDRRGEQLSRDELAALQARGGEYTFDPGTAHGYSGSLSDALGFRDLPTPEAPIADSFRAQRFSEGADTVPLPQPGPRTEGRNAAQVELDMTPQERALYDRHLSNLWGPGGVDNPPTAENPNESRSTLYQANVEIGGKNYNIPTVYDGKIVDVDEAVDRAKAQGLENFPSYPSEQAGDERYMQMHGYMDRDVGQFYGQKGAGGSDNSFDEGFNALDAAAPEATGSPDVFGGYEDQSGSNRQPPTGTLLPNSPLQGGGWQNAVRELDTSLLPPEYRTPDVISSIYREANARGQDPNALVSMIEKESNWDPRNVTDSYRGLFQLGPAAEQGAGAASDYANILSMNPVQQIEAYGRRWDRYQISQKLAAAGIDLSTKAPWEQAAIMQAFQFAPNPDPVNTDWLRKYVSGDVTSPTTNKWKSQAKEFQPTDMTTMTRRYYDYLNGPGLQRGFQE